MAKEMTIEKKVTINKDITTVFDFLQETKNQDRFSVWNMKDPEMKKSYSGTDGMVGFVYTWDSKDKSVGAGSQEIIRIAPEKMIEYEMKFVRPMKNTAMATFLVSNVVGEASTLVTWTFTSPTKFPMSLFSPIFKNILGKQLQQSLQNLKLILEK